MRIFLGVVTAACQTYFYARVRGYFRGRIALMSLLFMVVSPGFFVAGTGIFAHFHHDLSCPCLNCCAIAFLPSSFAMCCLMVAHGLWMAKNPSFFGATFMVALAALLGTRHALLVSMLSDLILIHVGWPFAAMVGVPLAFDALRSVHVKFILYAIASALLILVRLLSFSLRYVHLGRYVFIKVPSVAFDSYLYGRVVIAAYNIVHYNVISAADGGSALYGVEPWSWYLLLLSLSLTVLIIYVIP